MKPGVTGLLTLRRFTLVVLLPLLAAAFPLLGVLQQPFLQYVLAGSSLIFLAGKPDRQWIIGWLVLGLTTAWWLPGPATVAILCAALGLAGIALAGLRLLVAHPAVAGTAAVGAPLAPLAFATWYFINTSLFDTAFFPRTPTFDHAAAAADLWLGGPVSFWVGQVFRAHPWLARFELELYNALGVMMLGAYAARLDDPRRLRLLGLYVLAGVLGIFAYHILPVVGPQFVFASYPDVPVSWPSLQRVQVPLSIPRNAVPSLHLGWAMLAALALWPTRWRLPALGFVGVTLVACLGLGQHYLIDLLIAVPFTVGLWATAQGRWRLAAAGLATTAAWMGLLRTPLAASPLVLAGIPVAAILVWRLGPRRGAR